MPEGEEDTVSIAPRSTQAIPWAIQYLYSNLLYWSRHTLAALRPNSQQVIERPGHDLMNEEDQSRWTNARGKPVKNRSSPRLGITPLTY